MHFVSSVFCKRHGQYPPVLFNPAFTVATHDVYGEGEFKDDQMQTHGHGNVKVDGIASFGVVSGDISWSESTLYSANISGASNKTISLRAGNNTGRSGETTHGKQKAVYVYIKATSGLTENQQENVLNDVKNYIDGKNSYSTNEVKTGGKWIDGKPIYEDVEGIEHHLSWNSIDRIADLVQLLEEEPQVTKKLEEMKSNHSM